ncbi:SpaN/EivJ family type III secretion system needle length determinant [Acerihabitans arboris]|uniref:Surface presentation of antigen domain-containing protein n=1 Tax=Acerihabitans arboris TaxID=2691583 RepID=A0A845SFX0_9GAMM|nr:hypothetical protein [Acerihabitans arboris]NDL61521.1 hypothetical protein [Acerihabitans arboris]
MVIIDNLARGLAVSPDNSVESIDDIARRLRRDEDGMDVKKLRGKPKQASADNGHYAFIPATMARREDVLTLNGMLITAKTTMPIRQIQFPDQAQEPSAAARERETLPARVKCLPVLAGAAMKNSEPRDEGARAGAMVAQTALPEGDNQPAPGDGGRTPADKSSGESVDARILAGLPPGATQGTPTPSENQLAEARVGHPALPRQANPGPEANMSQENRGANAGHTLTYAFHSVPGDHSVRVSTGQGVTLSPSSHEVIRHMANHQMPGDYRILPAGDEQRRQQRDQHQEQKQEDDE